MLSWVLLFLVIAVIAVLGVWVSASLFGRGEALPPMDEPADVIAANRAAVSAGRYDDIALEVVPRGYRQDQVDALIAQLTGMGEKNEAVPGQRPVVREPESVRTESVRTEPAAEPGWVAEPVPVAEPQPETRRGRHAAPDSTGAHAAPGGYAELTTESAAQTFPSGYEPKERSVVDNSLLNPPRSDTAWQQ